MKNIIKYWQKQLEITDWTIKTERISRFQASTDNQIGVEFVGICREGPKLAIIYHTRKLTEGDIIHELLHIKYPEWTEMQVEMQREKLQYNRFDKGDNNE